MYNVKILIDKMKQISNVKTNTDLAKELNVSYNTLNTWLKRGKLPQEVIFNFANKHNASLDFLLLDTNIEKQENSLFSSNLTSKKQNITTDINSNIQEYIFYGEYEPLNIKPGDILELNSTLLHSNGHYLLKYNDVYFIARVIINVYTNKAIVKTLDNIQNIIDLIDLKSHNIGIITKIK